MGKYLKKKVVIRYGKFYICINFYVKLYIKIYIQIKFLTINACILMHTYTFIKETYYEELTQAIM